MIENKEIEASKGNNEPFELKGTTVPEKNISTNIPIFDDPTDNLLYNINRYALLINKIGNYGNSIPLGAFCFALAFILYGLSESNVHKFEINYLNINLLLFGGIGQIIAGILEYIKGRTFPANLYLIYGIYFICFFTLQYKNNYFNDDCKKFFYGSWAGLTFPLFIGSFHTNVFYLLQTLIGCAFFVVRCIGEVCDAEPMKTITSGVLEIVTGIISLYICFNQIVNQTFKFQLLPSFPLVQDNDVDINRQPSHFN